MPFLPHFDAVKVGELWYTVAQFPAEMELCGRAGAVKIKNGETVPDFIQTGSMMIYSGNVDWFVEYLSQPNKIIFQWLLRWRSH